MGDAGSIGATPALRGREAGIELEHGERTVGRQHQSGVQHPLEGGALRRQLAERRLEHLAPHPLEHPCGGDAHRA